MRLLFAFLLILANPDFETAVLQITAAADLSEVDPDEVDRLQGYLLHPLHINSLSRRQLTASGLFTPYQIETLLDYRARNGDILSPTELGIVDGFNPLTASHLALFLDFTPAGIADKISAAGEVQAGAGGKIASGQPGMQYQGRANATIGIGRVEAGANIAIRTPWAMPGARPEAIGWNIHAAYGDLEMTGGSFNARFGQGLALWTGTVFDSFTSPDALMRKPTGIRAYNSYTPGYAMQGLAAEYSLGIGSNSLNTIDFSAFTDISGKSAGANINWLHTHGSLGLSTIIPFTFPQATCLSVDFQQTIRGTVIYGELASRPGNAGIAGSKPAAILTTFAAVAGARFNPGPCQLAARITLTGPAFSPTRTVAMPAPPEIKANAAMTWLSDNRRHQLALGADYLHSKRQTKTVLTHNWTISPAWSLATRANTRVRRDSPRLRADLRSDLGWTGGPWTAQARINLLYCKSLAALTYLQAGYRSLESEAGVARETGAVREAGAGRSRQTGLRISVILQSGIFRADNWDDRIYVYRHDVPGSFSVPAMYGRGWWIAGYCSIRPIPHLRIYLRCDYTGYFSRYTPTGTERRPSLTARLQLITDF